MARGGGLGAGGVRSPAVGVGCEGLSTGAAAVDVVLRELERRRNLVGLASDESDRRNRNSDRVDP